MSELAIWFERKFRFDFPVELYPNLRVRLRGAPARLEELTSGLSRDQLIHKPDGKWSIQENAGHLLSVEPLWLARVDDFLKGAEVLTAADLTNRKTHEAAHNDRPLQEILSAFRQARETFVNRLEGLTRDDFARVAKHPRLNQPMRFVDHIFFAAEHDDHHLARIWERRQAGSD
jgi:uncharacterized damage-inducible protein DinB